MVRSKKIKNPITKVKKRDGRTVDFDQQKITDAIFKALTSTDNGGKRKAHRLSDKVVALLNKRFKSEKEKELPSVEKIQDIVEEVLILEDLAETAKAYILYREKRRQIRESQKEIEASISTIDNYLKEADWEIKENANMAFSLQGLNQYLTSAGTKKYWLNKVYPEEIRNATLSGDFHIHDLNTLSTYCCGWDLYDLLKKGFGGVPTKLESKPPRHLRTALGQLVNFFYTLQGESAGAQAVSSFDTLLAPFIRYDNLSYPQVKQAMQEFIFNCTVPTRVGFQTPFLNITLDINPSPGLADQPVIIGGEPQDKNYGDFQQEMNMVNQAFAEVMIEGDGKGRVFTFPIPTINITPDFDWDNPNLDGIWEMTAKYGIPYFANFVHSDMKPEDVRSMCCRLRLSNKELYKRGGGLFGSNPLTGSIGVVTINLPRLGYTSKTQKEFFEKLEDLMESAKESLEIKRKALDDFTEKGLYPYSQYYLSEINKMRGSYWGNHFSTIGLTGMNEALLNLIGEDIGTKKGHKLALKILEFMRDKMVELQEQTGNLYNLEATPAESTSYRLARLDKEKYPEIITAGDKEPYYTNSSQLPVDYTDDLLEGLEIEDDLQSKYTGGTVFHGFLGEKIPDKETVKKLIKTTFDKFSLPYFTLTPTFSICPHHGYISGEHFTCPKCTVEQPCEVYSRVVGYLRPVRQWNKGKQEEFKDRKEFKTK